MVAANEAVVVVKSAAAGVDAAARRQQWWRQAKGGGVARLLWLPSLGAFLGSATYSRFTAILEVAAATVLRNSV